VFPTTPSGQNVMPNLGGKTEERVRDPLVENGYTANIF
jgi:hypothetical protein